MKKKIILYGSRHVVNEITRAISFVCVFKFTKSATLTTTINTEICPKEKIFNAELLTRH